LMVCRFAISVSTPGSWFQRRCKYDAMRDA
jgi:hypothetical protein